MTPWFQNSSNQFFIPCAAFWWPELVPVPASHQQLSNTKHTSSRREDLPTLDPIPTVGNSYLCFTLDWKGSETSRKVDPVLVGSIQPKTSVYPLLLLTSPHMLQESEVP